MAKTFQLGGTYTVGPNQGAPSLEQNVITPLEEALTLVNSLSNDYALLADAPVSVDFGGLDEAHVVILKTTGKVTVSVTSADGTAQDIPIDTVLIQISKATPVTAIDLTRVSGVDTTVNVFLGKRI